MSCVLSAKGREPVGFELIGEPKKCCAIRLSDSPKSPYAGCLIGDKLVLSSVDG